MWAKWGVPRIFAGLSLASFFLGLAMAHTGNYGGLGISWFGCMIFGFLSHDMAEENRRSADAVRRHNRGMDRLMEDIRAIDDPYDDPYDTVNLPTAEELHSWYQADWEQ